jgi:catalase
MELAAPVAAGLGIALPAPLPRAYEGPIPDYQSSPSLSLLARPGAAGIRTRRVAILVANGVDGAMVRAMYSNLLAEGAQPRLVGARLGRVRSLDDCPLEVEITVEAAPSVLYDGLIMADGGDASQTLGDDATVREFLREQYRHGKPILAIGEGAALLASAAIPPALPDGAADHGLVVANGGDTVHGLALFKTALARHRVYARETDPPRV